MRMSDGSTQVTRMLMLLLLSFIKIWPYLISSLVQLKFLYLNVGWMWMRMSTEEEIVSGVKKKSSMNDDSSYRYITYKKTYWVLGNFIIIKKLYVLWILGYKVFQLILDKKWSLVCFFFPSLVKILIFLVLWSKEVVCLLN